MSTLVKLDEFTQAYVECAMWAETDGEEPLDRHFTIDDIAPESLAAMVADCARFQRENADRVGDCTKQAGHDFWLTRNHHGAGFWDGDWPEGDGEALTEAARAFGWCELYVGDDGRIYHV